MKKFYQKITNHPVHRAISQCIGRRKSGRIDIDNGNYRSVISERARFTVLALLSRFLTGQGAPPTGRAVDVTPVSRRIHNSYRS